MKLLILSAIHGNLDALHAIRESYDELWVLGDIVNYGPEPREALEAVRATASIVVQGNHDHAVGHCDDSRWSARFREVAEATRRFTSSQLSGAQKAYLRSLPVRVQVEREGVRFYLTHATPSDPHYGRIAPNLDDWVAELERLDADVLLVGHSHVLFIRQIGATQIKCLRMAHNHWVVAMMQPPRDGKTMTSKHRKPPNQRCCFLFRIEGYESCRRLRLRARPSASHR